MEIAIISKREVLFNPSSQISGRIKATLSLQLLSNNFIFNIKYFGLENKQIITGVDENIQEEEVKEIKTFENLLFEASFTKLEENINNIISDLELPSTNFLENLKFVLEYILKDAVINDFVADEILRFGLNAEDY